MIFVPHDDVHAYLTELLGGEPSSFETLNTIKREREFDVGGQVVPHYKQTFKLTVTDPKQVERVQRLWISGECSKIRFIDMRGIVHPGGITYEANGVVLRHEWPQALAGDSRRQTRRRGRRSSSGGR